MALVLIPNIAGGGGGVSVNSVTFGAGIAQGGTAADPIGNVTNLDGSIAVGADDIAVSAAYTAAVLAAAAAAAPGLAPVQSVTAGAGQVNSGTSANPILDVVAADATVVVAADSVRVGVISSANVDTTISTSASTLTVDQRLTDLERRFRLLLQRHMVLFEDIPPGLEDEVGVAMSIQ